MNNSMVNINFLGKTYTLPWDITTYINEHHCFEDYRTELLSFMMKNYADVFNLDNLSDEKTAYDKFRYYGNACVQKLLAKGIYDVTVDELTGSIPEQYTWKSCCDSSPNEGVKLFFTGLKDSLLEMCNAQLETVDSFLNQAQQAERIRDSQITGTGLEIISGDIIGFAVWAAMEKSALKQQTVAADAEFRNRIDFIQKQGNSRRETRLQKYAKSVWLPTLKNSTDLFIIALFKKYIDVLVERGRFNADALNYIDISKAQSILQNINSTENKAGIIEAAFLTCPFTPEIYEEAFKIGAPSELAECAKTFGMGEYLKSLCMKKCAFYSTNDNFSTSELVEKLSPYITVLSILTDKTQDEVLTEYIASHRKKTLDSIDYFVYTVQGYSNPELKEFIESLANVQDIEQYSYSEEDLKSNISSELIRRAIMRDDPLEYDDAITNAIDNIHSILKVYMSKLSSAKAEYLSRKKEHDEYAKRAYTECDIINKQIRSSGIFAFSKKKEMNKRIEEIKDRIRILEEKAYAAERKYSELIQ